MTPARGKVLASHKILPNDHFRRNADCMQLMTFIAGFPIQVQVSNILRTENQSVMEL